MFENTPHMSSDYPGSQPTDLGGFKGCLFEKESVYKNIAADRVIPLTLDQDHLILTIGKHHTSILLLIKTAVWCNLQTFEYFPVNMNHRSAFTSNEILHHPQHA